MLRSLVCLLLLAALVRAVEPSPCPAPADTSAVDLLTMQGKWALMKALRKGMPRREMAAVVLVVEKDKFTIKDGKRDEVVTVKLNGKKDPPEIDLKPERGRMVLGIYMLEKDQLTICFGDEGGTRPAKIDEKAYGMLVFKKAKK
jgi:uncharacterized protein (TIGR03067 family)